MKRAAPLQEITGGVAGGNLKMRPSRFRLYGLPFIRPGYRKVRPRLVVALASLLAACAHAAAASPTPSSQAEFLRNDAPESIVFETHGDGKVDRATLVDNGEALDLNVFVGDDKIHDPSRKPTLIKKAIARWYILRFESRTKGTFVLSYGCGGCSDSVETILKIVHRGPHFLVAGLDIEWDTRNGQGSCDVNLLNGNRVIARGSSPDQPKRKRSRVPIGPVDLDDWSENLISKLCPD